MIYIPWVIIHGQFAMVTLAWFSGGRIAFARSLVYLARFVCNVVGAMRKRRGRVVNAIRTLQKDWAAIIVVDAVFVVRLLLLFSPRFCVYVCLRRFVRCLRRACTWSSWATAT